MPISLSQFAQNVQLEGAFEILAVAKRLITEGKDVIELEIGDSPFPSSSSASVAATEAISAGQTRYVPSTGVRDLREAAAEYVNREYGFDVTFENILVGPGAKNFQQLTLELFVDPGDGVLVFSPHFPTYETNIARRGARMVVSTLSQSSNFRPNLEDVRRFVESDPSPKVIVLNSPHNPTGGIATLDDLEQIAAIAREHNIGIFSDEPYDRMAWTHRHYAIGAMDGMLDQSVTAYTFSKSYSMSGWRLGFAVSSKRNIATLATLTNTALSCVSPFTQLAGAAVLRHDLAERDQRMHEFQSRVEKLVNGLNSIAGFHCLMPGGSFYAFPCVQKLCDQFKITSSGLAMYLLEGADEKLGVACLGGECFGEAGSGFLRFSVTEPPERLNAAVEFIRSATADHDRVRAYVSARPKIQAST